MHNESNGSSSQSSGCTPNSHSSSPSPNGASISPGLHLNLSPQQIINLSNNTITLQSLDSNNQIHHQTVPQNYSTSDHRLVNNHELNNVNTEINYINVHQQQPQQLVQQPSQMLLQQNPIMSKTTKFKCEQCNMCFGSKSAHTSHMKSHMKQFSSGTNGIDMTNNRTNDSPASSNDQYQCDVCKKTFAVPARLVSYFILF